VDFGNTPEASQLSAECKADLRLSEALTFVLERGLNEVSQVLASQGIPVILLKGLAYGCLLYPNPAQRPGCDVDILVPPPSRQAVYRILKGLGFVSMPKVAERALADTHELEFRRGPLVIDVHFAFAPRFRSTVDMSAVWREAKPLEVGGASVLRLADQHAALYHAFHMALHHFHVPAIYLIDFERLLRRPEMPPMSDVLALAREWKMHTSFRTAMAMHHYWNEGEQVRGSIPYPLWLANVELAECQEPSRPVQLIRKLSSFDDLADAARFLVAFLDTNR